MKLFLPLLASLLLIAILNCCINECDTNNSTFVLIQIDSLNKPKAVKVLVTIDNIKFRDTTLSSFRLPLTLDRDSSVISITRTSVKDSAIRKEYKFTLGYSKRPFLRGPDCGMDMRIEGLSIISPKDEKIELSNSTVSINEAPNVKISL